MSLSDISSKFTESTLDEIVQKAGGTKHTSYKFGKGFKKGDSYLSKVFRLAVYGIHEETGAELHVNLIVKAMPDNMARRKLFHSAKVFCNEINFYEHVLPAFEEFQARRQPKDPFTEYPKCYATLCDGDNDFIALEDVSFAGYVAPKRQDYISLNDCMLTMRTLARFHAISLAMRALEPKLFQQAKQHIKEIYYCEANRQWYIGFFKLACHVALDAVLKTFNECSLTRVVAKKFLQPKTYDDMIKLVSTESPLAAFGHGDCWTPNFLTRYSNETGDSEAIKIIDFQLARVGSLALDISFFIYSCTSHNMRKMHYLELLQHYHKSACELLDDLGTDSKLVLPWQTFKAEMQEFGRFGVGMAIESLPMSMLEDNEVADLDDINEKCVLEDVWNIVPFEEPHKYQRLAQIFWHAASEKYLEGPEEKHIP